MKKLDRREKLRAERRAKFYVISYHILWDLFANAIGKPQFLFGVEGIPADAIVDNAGSDIMHDGVIYRVLHESFEPVEEGTIALFNEIMVSVRQANSLTPVIRSIKSTSEVERNETWVKINDHELYAVSLDTVTTAASTSPDTTTEADKNANRGGH